MTVQTNRSLVEAPRPGMTWLRVWTSAVFRPSVRTFERILADPGAHYSRAILWVFSTVFLALGLVVIVLSIQPDNQLAVQFGSLGAALFFGVLPAALLFAMLGGSAWVFLTEVWAASADAVIGHAPDESFVYDQLLYAYSAFLAPLVALSVVVALLASFINPLLHVVQAVICVYALALATLAARSVYRASWTRTIAGVLLGALPLAAALAFATLVLATWAGGA